MQNNKKIIWQIAACAMALGLILAGIGFISGGAKALTVGQNGIHLLKDTPYTLKNPNIEAFQSIDFDIQSADVDFIKSDHYGIEIHYSGDTRKPLYTVENGTLKVTNAGKNEFIFFNIDFGISNRSNAIKVYLPANVSLKDVTIKNASGDLNLGNFTAQKADIKVPFGNVTMHDVCSDTLSVTINSGDGILRNINAKKLQVNDYFGDITIDDMTASQLTSVMKSGDYTIRNSKVDNMNVTNKFGKIGASNITTTQLTAQCNSGDMEFSGAIGGKTDIVSKFGDVDFSTSLPESQYSYDLSVKFGDIKVNGNEDAPKVKENSGAANSLTISNSSGDINADFQK